MTMTTPTPPEGGKLLTTDKQWQEHAADVMQTNQALLRRIESLADALGDTLRILDAVRFTVSLGKGQTERVAKAKAVLAISRPGAPAS